MKRFRVWWKCRDGFVQPLAGQIHQQALEFAEGPAGLKGLIRRLHRFEGLHAFDEHKRAPVFAIAAAVDATGRRGSGMTMSERRVMSRASCGFKFAADVRGDAHDVLHHRGRVLEDVLVDLLVDVADAHAALVVGGGVGFVDVADLEGLGVEDFAVDLELPGDFLKLFLLISHSRFRLKQILAGESPGCNLNSRRGK